MCKMIGGFWYEVIGKGQFCLLRLLKGEIRGRMESDDQGNIGGFYKFLFFEIQELNKDQFQKRQILYGGF